jgi:hypothetical protein
MDTALLVVAGLAFLAAGLAIGLYLRKGEVEGPAAAARAEADRRLAVVALERAIGADLPTLRASNER